MEVMYRDWGNETMLNRTIECQKLINASLEDDSEGLFCPPRMDGWSCWPRTPAGTVANQSCPDFVVGFESYKQAFHKCEANGSWFNIFYNDVYKPWANYTECVNNDDLEFRQVIILIQQIGYSISLVALLLSLFILAYFKSLRCARITVHMNLFASFAINNFFWLMWYTFVTQDPTIAHSNPVWCKVLHSFTYSFTVSTYAWMLCEGLYLHTVLVSAFISESHLLKYMIILGWSVPLLTLLIYAPVRGIYGETAEETEYCWMNDSRFNTILQVPVVITMALNLIFLINIVRVLLIKLRKGPANDRGGVSRAPLQALRATMLLVPLLGLNFLLTPFKPEADHPWEHVYEIVSALTTTLQGFCVAILFCFCNGEVIGQMKRKWKNLTFRTRANSCTVTTVSVRKSSQSTKSAMTILPSDETPFMNGTTNF